MSEIQFDSSKVKTYNGNQLIKRAGETIKWTPELIQEMVRCGNDPVYFIEKYMKIIGKKGLMNFHLYPYQKKIIKSFQENRNTIVTTARQAGKSTVTCGFILWFIIFNDARTVALLANKGDTAREIMSKVTFGYQYLPKWLQQGVGKLNEGSIELENNSRVFAAATASDSIRGYSIDVLFIDEAAHIDNWNEFFMSVYPTISEREDSKIILVSTPNGLNDFHKTWSLALQKENNYNPILVNWREVPGRDEAWRENILAGLNFDTEKFAQEMECEFMGSSGTLINGQTLKRLVSKPPIVKRDGLTQYYAPVEGHLYITVCDVSRGKGLDYSAFQCIDVTSMPYQQVCTYRNNSITPVDYAEIIHRTARAYNKAAVLVEVNDIGEQVAYTLAYDFEYDNILSTENAGAAGKRITSGFSGKVADRGVRTTKLVKAVGCSMLKLLIEGDQLILNDQDTIKELSRFSKKGPSYQAESGAHDDLVMCLVLFGWLSEQQYFKEYCDINTLMTLREKSEAEMEADMLPFGFNNMGGDDFVDAWDDAPKTGPLAWMFEVKDEFNF